MSSPRTGPSAYGVIATVDGRRQPRRRNAPARPGGRVTSPRSSGGALDIAVVQVRPEPDLPFEPGQSFADRDTVRRPRLWRYSQRRPTHRVPDGTIEFHVQLVPGGQVSRAPSCARLEGR